MKERVIKRFVCYGSDYKLLFSNTIYGWMGEINICCKAFVNVSVGWWQVYKQCNDGLEKGDQRGTENGTLPKIAFSGKISLIEMH